MKGRGKGGEPRGMELEVWQHEKKYSSNPELTQDSVTPKGNVVSSHQEMMWRCELFLNLLLIKYFKTQIFILYKISPGQDSSF